MRTLIGLCSLSAMLVSTLPAHAQAPAPATGLRSCVDVANPYPTKLAIPNGDLVPETARVSGRASGTVTITVSLDEKGGVTGTSVARSDSPFLNAAALDAAHRSTYAPATHGCTPIKSQYTFVVPFGEATSSVSTSKSAKGEKTTTTSSNVTAGSQGNANCSPGGAWLKSAPSASALPPLAQPGSATIHVVVDKTGAVQSATPLKSDLPQAYSDAALQMVKSGTFSPKLGDDCKPADDVVDVSIGFHP